MQVSSYGLTAGTLPGTSDVDSAIGGKMASFQGRDPQTGENILAVSYPLFFNSRVVGVLRYVTSLREAQHRVLVESLLASAAALVCMALIAASNAIFINNVVQPVAVVSDAARRISGGSYGIMIENHYRDELGELVDNINDMSLKISQAEKIQQEFISSVSHELRTPLTAISGWAETLSADPGANIDQTKRGLGIILKESRRLTTLVEELLEFTKMQDGRFTLRVESVDLASELEDAIYTYFELFRQEGIEVSYKGPDEDVPPIVADSERMKQVFCNVLDNAAKHGGAVTFVDSMVKGVKALMFSADYFPDEDVAEPSKFDQWLEKKLGNEKMQKFITALAVFLSLGLTILLFFLLPTFLAGFIDPYIKSAAVHNLVESVIKLVIFFAYMILCSKQKDIYRVFQYHGAEHKTIFCYEAGLPLTVENCRIQPRHHPRCGTSFLFVVVVVSILVSSLVFSFVNWRNMWVRVALHLLLLIPIVGVTYEFNRYVGGHDNKVTRFLARPGLWLQNFTTNEPDDSMLEVAIRALELVIPEEKGKDAW